MTISASTNFGNREQIVTTTVHYKWDLETRDWVLTDKTVETVDRPKQVALQPPYTPLPREPYQPHYPYQYPFVTSEVQNY